MNRGLQEGAFQVAFSDITRASNLPRLVDSNRPCAFFNKGRCRFTNSTCKYRHVCQRCRQLGHSQLSARCTLLPPDLDSGSVLNNAAIRETSSLSTCPAAEATLTAAPVPRPPPISEFPSALRITLKRHWRLFKIVTPIKIDKFENLLRTHPNRPYVESVITALRDGFWPWAINIPWYPPTHDESRYRPTTPKNLERKVFLQKQLEEEVKAKRYSLSIGHRLLPGLYCMPMVVSRSSGKLRVINDHAAGEFSLNSRIPKEETSVKNDDINALAYVLRQAQAQARGREIVLFKSDVRHAYRLMPMHPLWQAMQAVRIDGEYYIDRCNCFGGSASGRIFYAFYSLVLWIAAEVKGVKDVLAHVDDNFSWEYASRRRFYKPYGKELPEKQAKLLELWDEVGIPHSEKKQESGTVLTIVGHEVDMQRMRISLPSDQREKIDIELDKLLDKSARRPWPRHDLQKAVGVINWALSFNPLLKPGVHSLVRALRVEDEDHNVEAGSTRLPSPEQFPKPRPKILITIDIQEELRWLKYHLGNSRGISFSSKSSAQTASMKMIVQASIDTGAFNFWFLDTREAFKSSLGVGNGMNQDFRAVFAVVCAVDHIQLNGEYSDVHRIVVYNDNPFAVEMLKTFKAGEEGNYNQLLICVADILLKRKIALEIHYLALSGSKEAEVAGTLEEGRGMELPNFSRFKHRAYTVSPLLQDIAKRICEASEISHGGET